jgi:hypothetical protein
MKLLFAWVVGLADTNALRLGSLSRDVDYVDSSNCTYTEWSECALKPGSYSECESSRIFDLAANQTLVDPKIVPCNHNAGLVESRTCRDGRCPDWQVGNWSDCANTCNVTQADIWSAMQVRDVNCTDSSGWYYASKVCVNVRGPKPLSEQFCPCSHQTQPKPLYPADWSTVGV